MTNDKHTKGKDTVYGNEEEKRKENQMDTGVDSGTLAIYQAAAEANARIDVLRRITQDSRENVPVKTICQIFGWKYTEAPKKKKPDRTRIVEMYKNGKTPKQIASSYGVEEMAIREVLKTMNLIDQGTTI